MERTNCPNCGAPLPLNCSCEYCGTNIQQEPVMRSMIKQDVSGITLYCESLDGTYTELWANNKLYAKIPRTAYI